MVEAVVPLCFTTIWKSALSRVVGFEEAPLKPVSLSVENSDSMNVIIYFFLFESIELVI